MQQLVFIHGGETFDTYEEYLDALRSSPYEPFVEKQLRWKHGLKDALGEAWEVHAPSMPSPMNAKYVEWTIEFEKVIPHLRDGVLLVGHSLGGIFLAKYLNEHALPVTAAATFLVAAPFDTEGTDYSLADFVLPASLDGLRANGGTLHLYHSKDDPVVPFDAVEKYARLLPSAVMRIFEDRGHFMQPEFPELIVDIKAAAQS